MMGQWHDVRSASGRLVCRIDAERRLVEIVRNGEEVLVDLDAALDLAALRQDFGELSRAAQRPEGPAVGPGEVK